MYDCFADYYDTLMSDADYLKRAEYLCSLFLRFDRMPSLLLDLACGTGAFSCAFAQKGVSVIGVDISPEMLFKAREKAAEINQDILFLCQDAAQLDLYGTVDGAICCMDSLNHITDYNELCKAIKRVSLFLEPGRLFIFDVNTVFKAENILGDNVFVTEEDGVYCVWQNEYEPETRMTYMSLDFFSGDGINYTRSTQLVEERAYTDEELLCAIEQAGLSVEAVLGDMTFEAPKAEEERKIFVLRKKQV